MRWRKWDKMREGNEVGYGGGREGKKMAWKKLEEK